MLALDYFHLFIHRMKWRHSNLWSRYDLSLCCGANMAYYVRLSGEDLSRCSNKIESAGLRKCPYYRYLTSLVILQYQTFPRACRTSWRENSCHRYGMKKLRHCHPVFETQKAVIHILHYSEPKCWRFFGKILPLLFVGGTVCQTADVSLHLLLAGIRWAAMFSPAHWYYVSFILAILQTNQ